MVSSVLSIRFPYSASTKRLMTMGGSFSAATSASASSVTPSSPKSKPWLLVGLGNPGKRYQGTRHNVGFELLDAVAEAEGISVSSVKFKALFGKGFIGDVPIMLAKPQTFMNCSGDSGHSFLTSIYH